MIEARGLTKRYGPTLAVDDLSFEVRPGHVTGFLGPNGSGKSTTMRMILGLDAPDGGGIAVNGSPYRQHRFPLHEVGALLDAKALHGGRSARNHLLCLAKSNRIPRRRVGEVLDIVGLSEVGRKRAGNFSLGMGQRLGIAAALLGDPGILMFDEPVNGLDPEGVLWIRNLLKSLAAEGRTVFVSSHLMSEMALTADHLVVIGRGRLIADTSVKELTTGGALKVVVRSPRPELADVLRLAGASVTAEDGALGVTGLSSDDIGDLAFRNGLPIYELTPKAVTLEEAFFELTENSTEFRAESEARTYERQAS
ncbi:MAG: transporter ATP-binding protein [Actinomycetia bacterium]|nr:transporter ATP-binding protein [Actinomycetes bacterium]